MDPTGRREMITKPTVLILGAGASAPYGFPTGPALAADVVEKLNVSAPDGQYQPTTFILGLSRRIPSLSLNPEMAQAFGPAFRWSGCQSLDEFVQPAGNRQYLPLVKASMAMILASKESDRALHAAANTGEDWYSYLFRHMRTDRIDDFSGNLLRVITFNFDRSFERRLFLMLRHAYGVSDAVAAEARSRIDVLHLHGALGREGWLPDEASGGREYGYGGDEVNYPDLMNSIKVVHEEVAIEDLNRAHDWLLEAHTLCFLGFGFHRLTMSRLRMNEPYPNSRKFATALGYTDAEIQRLLTMFTDSTPKPTMSQSNSLSLLRSYEVIASDR